jgi:hypothetical protein
VTAVRVTLAVTSSDKPACSARLITGSRPAHETRVSSSKTSVAPATNYAIVSPTARSGAGMIRTSTTPIFPPGRHLLCRHTERSATGPRIQA